MLYKGNSLGFDEVREDIYRKIDRGESLDFMRLNGNGREKGAVISAGSSSVVVRLNNGEKKTIPYEEILDYN